MPASVSDEDEADRGDRDRAAEDEARPAAPGAVLAVAAVEQPARHDPHAVDALARGRRAAPGSSVSEASTETAGISMPPMPIERISGSGSATMRQQADGDGRAGHDHGAAGVRHRLDERGLDVLALAQLVAEPEDHQQGVVDRQPEADERDEELHDDRDVGDVGQPPHQREGVEDRGDGDADAAPAPRAACRRRTAGSRARRCRRSRPRPGRSRRRRAPSLVASSSASRPVTLTVMPAGSPLAAAARIAFAPLSTSTPAWPARVDHLERGVPVLRDVHEVRRSRSTSW